MRQRQNSLWVATTQGLYRIRGTEVDHYENTDGLSSNWVRGILEDREGNVWVATSQGIDMFRDLRVKSISTARECSRAQWNRWLLRRTVTSGLERTPCR